MKTAAAAASAVHVNTGRHHRSTHVQAARATTNHPSVTETQATSEPGRPCLPSSCPHPEEFRRRAVELARQRVWGVLLILDRACGARNPVTALSSALLRRLDARHAARWYSLSNPSRIRRRCIAPVAGGVVGVVGWGGRWPRVRCGRWPL